MGWLQTEVDWQIASYLLALALILMAASVRNSLGFYTRREFRVLYSCNIDNK